MTFNKVLEHVEDPVAMLARALRFLRDDGAVYVELPDGELAALDPDGPGREGVVLVSRFDKGYRVWAVVH